MIDVVIRAPLLSISGYGVHSRQVFKWLNERHDVNLHAQIVQWGNTSWMINSEHENGLVGEVMKASSNTETGKSDISFQIQLPDEWDPDLAKKNVGISAVVETDKCSSAWIDAINRMDAVIIPSEHVKQTILNSGHVTTDLFVIPEWYFEEIDRNETISLDLDLDTSFNFLLVGQFTGNDPETDRKNIFYTLKWFCEVFKDDPDVGLILKTNHGRGTKIDRQITNNKIKHVLNEIRPGKFPKIHLIHGNLTTSEVAGLYTHPDVKCFLSLTRGEGFGLPLLESAACGLPVMTTNWSAHLDFLNLGKFIPINYKLTDIPERKVDGRIFVKNTKWAEPLEDDFKKKVIKLKSKYAIPKSWATELSKKIKQHFSSSAIIPKYNKMLNNILEIEK